MKRYYRLGMAAVVFLSLIFSARADERKIHFKNRFSINQIFSEPQGIRGTKRSERPLPDNFAPPMENPPVSLHPGWPRTFAYGQGIGSCGPVRMIESDLDGDGKGEIVTSMQLWNKGLVFKENGDIAGKFFIPQTLNERLSLGDVDGDKKKEIATFSMTDAVPLYFYIFDHLGNLELRKDLYPNIDMFMPIVADLNNDRKDEIIIKSGVIGKTTLQILDGRGDVISKFSTRIKENTASVIEVNPVVGNFDNDIDLEIVVPLWNDESGKRRTYIEIYNLDGTPVPGWEKVAVPDFIYNPVCGDLNGDGRDEIIGCGWEGALFILASDGKLLLNRMFSPGQAIGSPAIGDINNDGIPEIVFNQFNNYGPTNLLAIDPQGEIILNKAISSHAIFSPLIGDMDGDGIPDIVFGNYDYIYAFDGQGNDIGGFPIEVHGETGFIIWGPGASICDIDHDGKIEITYTKDNAAAAEFSLFVLDIDSPYDPATMEWPMHQHDAGHGGRYVSKLNRVMYLDLVVERREARAFSIQRQYGWIQFLGGNSDTPVAQYQLMRRQGNGDFVSIRTIAPSELQDNQFQMFDKYLEKDIPYTYRVRAYDAAGKLVGTSSGKTI
jgi:hypothetical protein